MAQSNNQAVHLYQLPNCIICMDRLEKDIYFLKCGHVFHQRCILDCMVKNNKECPMCKKRIQSERDVNKLFFQVQKNTQTEDQIHKMLESYKQEQDGNVLQKAIGKLRKVIAENQSLIEKIKYIQKDRSEMKLKEQEDRKGVQFMQKQMKRAEKQKKQMAVELQNLRQYSSILEGDKEDLEKIIKSQQTQIMQYELQKKASKDKQKDHNFYESMKNQYLATDPHAGLQYFCQLAQSLKLDIRKLQKDVSNYERANKQKDKHASQYRRRRQQFSTELQKQKQMTVFWQDKCLRSQDRVSRLLRKLKQRNIQPDIIDQNSITSSQIIVKKKQQKKNDCPAMLFRKEKKQQEKAAEIITTNLFDQLGLDKFRRLDKKSRFNGFKS